MERIHYHPLAGREVYLPRNRRESEEILEVSDRSSLSTTCCPFSTLSPTTRIKYADASHSAWRGSNQTSNFSSLDSQETCLKE